MDKKYSSIKPLNNMHMKSLLEDFLKNKADYTDEYVKVATAALARAGFERIVIFTHTRLIEVDGNPVNSKQLVMINMNASISKIASGIILNDDGEIDGFKISEDYKSVTTNALTRCLIMESIDDETDIIRLRTLTKDKCSWILHYNTNEINQKAGLPENKWYPKFLCNTHTHGLAAFHHKDFQVVLDIGPSSTAYLLNALAERVRNGEVFTDGELVDNVYEECRVKLAIAKEGNREVFRVLIPDAHDRYPGDEGCEYPYSEQDRVLE